MTHRRISAAVLAWLFLIAYAAYGLWPTKFFDDYVFCHGVYRDMPLADVLQRNWQSTGVVRFLRAASERWLMPRLADHFWIAHLLAVGLHGLNAWLLYRLLMRRTGLFGLSFAAAGVFALWPLKNEAIFWAAQFNVSLGTSLMLAAGWLWLRAEPARPGWWLRAWPVPILLFLAGQFSEQAMTGGAALPLLSLSRHEGEPWWRVPVRIGLQGLYAAAAIFLFAALFVSTVRTGNIDNLGLQERHKITEQGRWADKAQAVALRYGEALPALKMERTMLREGLRQVPRIWTDAPVGWTIVWLVTAAGLGFWLSRPAPSERDLPAPPLMWAALLLFSAAMWAFAQVPMLAAELSWSPMRTMVVPGMAQAVALVTLLVLPLRWAAWKWPAAEDALERTGRAGLGALLTVYALTDAADGRQYLRQYLADDAQARQITALLADVPAGPAVVMITDNPFKGFSQKRGLQDDFHIINGWSLPWTGVEMLRRHRPDVEWSVLVHPYPRNIPRWLTPEEVLPLRESLFAFRLPEWDERAAADQLLMEPVTSFVATDSAKRRREYALPRMRKIAASRGLQPAEPPLLGTEDVRNLPEPP